MFDCQPARWIVIRFYFYDDDCCVVTMLTIDVFKENHKIKAKMKIKRRCDLHVSARLPLFMYSQIILLPVKGVSTV